MNTIIRQSLTILGGSLLSERAVLELVLALKWSPNQLPLKAARDTKGQKICITRDNAIHCIDIHTHTYTLQHCECNRN